jgi:AcrR family transcriptional regulator
LAVAQKTPPVRPSREEVLTAYRRAALLDAARRVFGARGFDDATVDAIAAEAHVAKGTVYLYFPSKVAIYDAAFAQGMDELTALTDERIRAAASPRDAVHAFVEARVAYFQDHPDYFRMYATEVSRQLTDRTPRKSTCRDALMAQTRVLRDVFARAVAAGQLRGVDPGAAALAVFDITRGLVARRLLSRSRSDVAKEVAFLTDLVWAGLQPRSDPSGQHV